MLQVLKFLKIFTLITTLLIAISGELLAKDHAKDKSVKLITDDLWYKLDPDDLDNIKKTFAAIQQKDYSQALQTASKIKNYSRYNAEAIVKTKPGLNEALRDIVLWNKFSGNIDFKSTSFSDISRFANDNPFFPSINDIRRNVEKVAIANDVPYQVSEQYFTTNPAGTTESKVYVMESKINSLIRSSASDYEKEAVRREVKKSISQIWVNDNFSAEGEKEFLEKYQTQISELDHIKRIDRLLWDGKIEDAKRIMFLVDEDHKKLFEAIIELQDMPRYIDQVVFSVPRRLRDNEGLTYRRVLWYKAEDKIDEVLNLLIDLPRQTRFSEKWWGLRRLYGREMLKAKKYKAAYVLISNHGLSFNSTNFWEAEWTSGWIALRFLNEPKQAYRHFEVLRQNVSQPVTLSRSAYWLGMAAEKMGHKAQAIEWYKNAVQYPTFFYGQLAIHKHRNLDPIGAKTDIILPKDPAITVADMNKIAELRAAQVAYLLALAGDKVNATRIFEWIVNNAPTEGQIAVVMKVINTLGDREIDARISRAAARKNVFFIKDKFQILPEIVNDQYAPLVHAIIKQESGFVPTALSGAGAMGFMQIMPNTAKLIAKDLGIRYDKKKLASDINYNVILGSAYIKKLIERFEGSEMMAIASYNAGPNATQRWVNEFYDPRKEQDIDKIVDWIELITYSETRNYVQRVIENLIVYKYLMSRVNYDDFR